MNRKMSKIIEGLKPNNLRKLRKNSVSSSNKNQSFKMTMNSMSPQKGSKTVRIYDELDLKKGSPGKKFIRTSVKKLKK